MQKFYIGLKLSSFWEEEFKNEPEVLKLKAAEVAHIAWTTGFDPFFLDHVKKNVDTENLAIHVKNELAPDCNARVFLGRLFIFKIKLVDDDEEIVLAHVKRVAPEFSVLASTFTFPDSKKKEVKKRTRTSSKNITRTHQEVFTAGWVAALEYVHDTLLDLELPREAYEVYNSMFVEKKKQKR